jgi:plastocyanin
MIRPDCGSMTRCACVAALLFVISNGCGAPSATTATSKEKAGPDKTTTAAGDVVTVVRTAAKAEDKANGIKLSGRVALDGAPPKRRVINTSKDAACGKLHGDKPVMDEDLIVDTGGGVKNSFVFVRRGAPKQDYPLPEKPAKLDQQGCMFQPRVQGVRVGQRLLVANADPVTHNVRTFPVVNQAFNFGQPPDTEVRERVFTQAEREVEVQCDIHPWMHAYIFVMDHPFFSVSDGDGAYAIQGLPPGDYTLECWHEKLGKQRKDVKLGDEPLDVSFTFQQ